MTKGQHGECMCLLVQAKRGDEGAHRRLVDIVATTYAGMIRRFYTSDPILGDEDLKSEFYWGIWRAVAAVDERGDPIFHLAQRGQWVVKSLITSVNRRRHGTSEKEGGISVVSLDFNGAEGGWVEPADESIESDPLAVVEINEDRNEAHERVLHILVNADLAPRHKEIVQMLLAGDVDLGERLARKEIASKLGVSGQRVTQLVNGMEHRMHAADEVQAA